VMAELQEQLEALVAVAQEVLAVTGDAELARDLGLARLAPRDRESSCPTLN
jgi:hypothetical protein